jgi:predicted membrane-bound mannosyltransferase
VTLADFCYPVYSPFGVLALKKFEIIWLSNLLTVSAPYEVYSRNAPCALNSISTFLLELLPLLHLNDTNRPWSLFVGVFRSS